MTAREAIAAIRRVVSSAADGGFFPDERKQLDVAISWLFFHSRGHAYCHEKCEELQDYVAKLGSRTVHRKRNGGPHQVRIWIDGALDSLESNLPE